MDDQASSTGAFRARVVRRAMTDDNFRQQLLASPRAAIEQELAVTLPASLEIVVVEETPSRMCLVRSANFDKIVAELVARRPAYSPGWTDFNES